MKTRSSTANVITAILASLLSILLVAALLGSCAAGLGSSFTQPKVLSHLLLSALQEVDYEEILRHEAEGLGLTPNRYHEAEIVEEFMESNTMETLMDLYAEDAAAAMTGTLSQRILTPTLFKEVVHRNAGELVDIVCRIDRNADPITVKASLLAYVDNHAEELIQAMPVEEFTQDSGEVAEAMELLSNCLIVLLAVALVLALLLYACRYYRFGGFLWLGVDTLIAGGLVGGVALVVKEVLTEQMLYKGDPEIIEAVMSAFAGLITLFALPLLVLGVVFIALFILLKYTVVRKKLAAANATAAPDCTAPTVPAEPIAPAPTEASDPNPQ